MEPARAATRADRTGKLQRYGAISSECGAAQGAPWSTTMR